MRIAIFTEVFLPKIDGVVTRLTRTLDALAELGHEVLVFAPGDPPSSYAGFKVIAVPGFSFKPVYPEITVGFPSPKVVRELRRFSPDVIHAVNPVWLAAFGALYARFCRIPLVASFHTNVPEYTQSLGIGWLRHPASRWIITLHNLAAVNLCTSGPMVEKARAQGIKNVVLWPKAVDTHTYHPRNFSQQMRSQLTDNHPEAPLVIYVGRMSAEKNLSQLPEIMNQVRETIPEARLAMVGAGPQLEHLRENFDSSYCTFSGYLSGTELAAAFASGDVFAFPSTTETLGLVALESFASGVPVVGANAGGIPFVIDESVTGYLIDPSDTAAFAQRIGHLLSNEEERAAMGRQAREEAKRHNWISATKTLVTYYGQALEKSAGS